MNQLSLPSERAPLHVRQVHCAGYERADGLWDVEGRMSDVRSIDLDGGRGSFPRRAGEPLHLMSLRITLDDDFTIVAAEACTHQAPYGECPRIASAYGRLVGLRIAAGFTGAVKGLFRGEAGCTHLTELLGPMATTAFQAIRPALERRRVAAGLPAEPALEDGAAPAMLGSCYGLRSGGQAALVRWGRQAP